MVLYLTKQHTRPPSTTGKTIGYVRVSTSEQNADRQLDGLKLDKKFIDTVSGKSLSRPQLDALIQYVR